MNTINTKVPIEYSVEGNYETHRSCSILADAIILLIKFTEKKGKSKNAPGRHQKIPFLPACKLLLRKNLWRRTRGSLTDHNFNFKFMITVFLFFSRYSKWRARSGLRDTEWD